MRRNQFLIVAAFMAFSGLSAVNTVIFVHGRSSGNNHCGWGTTDVGNYWGSSKDIELNSWITSTAQRYFVGYHGDSDPRSWSGYGDCGYGARDNLDYIVATRCDSSVGNYCKVICHSAGCYAVDTYLSANVGYYTYAGSGYGTIQTKHLTGITYVMALSSASGGSELADSADWWGVDGTPMTLSLRVGVARGAGMHDSTRGIAVKHLMGDPSWDMGSGILPGEDDGAVAFHSGCGLNAASDVSTCSTGTKWSGHSNWYASTSLGQHNTSVGGYQWAQSAHNHWTNSYGGTAFEANHSDMKTVGRNVYNYSH
ncbi:MAG: hypothetical protein HS115_05330 [Spirochaetales bacterium]|nr:hypothetical protein [Spirochaetales bacterium]